jgi:ribosomal protein L37AE/L43A
MYEVLPPKRVKNARKELPTPERGERLCRAFEMYRAVLPESGFDFEEVVFLVMAVAQGSEIHVNRCEGCSAVILSGRYTGGHWHCTHCDGSSEEGVDQDELPVESILRAGAGTKTANKRMSAALRSVRRTRKETH